MSMNNNNEEANVIVVKETLKQQCSDDKEIIEDDTKANLKGNNDAPCNIAEPPDARKATTAPGYSDELLEAENKTVEEIFKPTKMKHYRFSSFMQEL